MHQRLEAVTDLAKLPNVSDDVIVSCLRERFMSDIIYTNLGTSSLVAVNPHKYVPSNADSVMHKYAAEHRNTVEDKELLPPHIFQLANNAYYHMRRTTQDQCIVLRYVIILLWNCLGVMGYCSSGVVCSVIYVMVRTRCVLPNLQEQQNQRTLGGKEVAHSP